MIGGDNFLNVNFALSERGSRADQYLHEIWRILYLRRSYYNGIWNY